MPRKNQDPFLAVQRYFEEAPVASLGLALAVVKEVVRRRGAEATTTSAATPVAVAKVKKKTRGPNKPKATTQPAPVAVAADQP